MTDARELARGHGGRRRIFAWEHALGAGAVTAMVVVMAFIMAPAAEASLKGDGAKIPGLVVVIFDVCTGIRSFGWMLAWFPAVTVGFVAGAMGSRGRRKWLALRLWFAMGVGAGLVMGAVMYGAILQSAMKQAGG